MFGWSPEILAVEPRHIERSLDALLLESVPDEVPIHNVKALSLEWTQYMGVESLAFRSLPYYLIQGSRRLARGDIDLVYFSTTAFPVFSLGPLWRRWYGIPYVLDLQDPWVTNYYNRPDTPSPPGGRFKHSVHQMIARTLEPPAIRGAAHIISVSPTYLEILSSRYREVETDKFTVLPFGAPKRDFELLASLPVVQDVFDPSDGQEHWVYVGSYIPQMEVALRPLFRALHRSRQAQPKQFQDLRLHFIGTQSSEAGETSPIVRMAEQEGIEDLVSDQSERVPYFTALRCLQDADALFILGSDDGSYTPSKLYPYVLADKPLLAVSHEKSSLTNVISETGAGTLVTFTERGSLESTTAAIETSGWLNGESPPEPSTDWETFNKYAAREMTRTQCQIFDRCVGQEG